MFFARRFRVLRPLAAPLVLVCGALCLAPAFAQEAPQGFVQQPGSPLLYHVETAQSRLEMTANTSRILSLDVAIPKAQVSNPEILDLLPLSATQVQVHAKKAGVTQINLWDAENNIRSIDVVVLGDAQELQVALKTVFPTASLKVVPLPDRVIISGFVDRAEDVARIEEVAASFYPSVVNAITVGGVQQVLLHIKVMEVSRTRLRTMGVDWGFSQDSTRVAQSVSGLLASEIVGGALSTTGGESFGLGVIEGSHDFFMAVEAMRQNNVAKVLAEPSVMTISGRPAFFNDGGEFPIIVPQSLGTVSIEYRRFGTQVDFVPIVLGNGNIRLEVRPRVSEIDLSRSVVINNATVPGLRVREIDTGAELRSGQTLCLAGLVQTRMDGETRGIPWLMDIPYAGAMFRRNSVTENEVELLIMVTPQLVAPMDPCEVPPCGPGMMTDTPNDCELFGKGYIEVPRTPPMGGASGDYEYTPAPEMGGSYEQYEEVLPPPEGAAAPQSRAPGPRRGTAAGASRETGARRTTGAAGTSRSAETDSAQGAAPAPQTRNNPTRRPARESADGRSGGRTTRRTAQPASTTAEPGFIGPTGYDLDK